MKCDIEWQKNYGLRPAEHAMLVKVRRQIEQRRESVVVLEVQDVENNPHKRSHCSEY
jgi:hypothetical protein